jgi:predicted transposase/invertase (TIGR01784 family)
MKRDDLLWKAILEDVFDDFLRFFHQYADQIFDMERGFEFLDKELEELFPPEEGSNVRYVDKLVKVYLQDGQEKWILVHVEVQGYRDPHFEERMYTYYYRIYDKYQRDITAWAIFTDNNRQYHPKEFKLEFLGTSLSYKFNTYKVIAQDEHILRNSDNPFSIIILTALLEIKKGTLESKELIDLKIELAKNLLIKGISKEKIRHLMNFLKYYVRLDKEDSEIFEQKLNFITDKKYPMGTEQYLLQKERMEGFEQGIEQGIEKGIEQGIEQGIEKGALKKTIEMVLSLFDDGFQLDIIAKHTKISTDDVLDILRENGRV